MKRNTGLIARLPGIHRKYRKLLKLNRNQTLGKLHGVKNIPFGWLYPLLHMNSTSHRVAYNFLSHGQYLLLNLNIIPSKLWRERRKLAKWLNSFHFNLSCHEQSNSKLMKQQKSPSPLVLSIIRTKNYNDKTFVIPTAGVKISLTNVSSMTNTLNKILL